MTVPQTRWREVEAGVETARRQESPWVGREEAGSGLGSTFTSEVEDSKEENTWGEGKQERGLGPASGPAGLAGVGRKVG